MNPRMTDKRISIFLLTKKQTQGRKSIMVLHREEIRHLMVIFSEQKHIQNVAQQDKILEMSFRSTRNTPLKKTWWK